MAVDAPSVILSCSAYDSLSHAALRYLLPQSCTCEHSHKICSNTTHSDLVCSLCPGRVSHPFDILVVLKHLEELHDQPRCSDLQSTSAGSCVQIRAVMFVGYAVPENVQFSVRSSYHHILFSYGPSTLSRWVCCSSILSS